jgi:hypothetical protein
VASALLVPLAAFAQVPMENAQSWTDPGTAGWSNRSPEAALTNPGGFLELRHGAQSQPKSVADIAQGAVGPGVLPTNIAFRFTASDATPSALRLYLHSSHRDHSWYVNLTPPQAGEDVAFDVPVNKAAAAWGMGPNSTEDDFLTDLRSMDWVGVYVRRHGEVAPQSYRIDDFTLRGLQFTDDDDMDGMPNGWESGHGLDRADWHDARLDKDGDGLNNYGEFRSGTLPDDPDSFFRVEIAETNGPASARSVVLRWQSIPDRRYTVWRAEGLGGEFTRLRQGLDATPDTNEYMDAGATNVRCFFYRVQVE